MCVFCSKCWHPSRVALLWLGKQLSKRCGGYLEQLLIWLGLEMVLFSSLGCSWMTFISIDEFLWCIHFCGTVHVECTTVVSGECRFLTPPQFKNAIIGLPFHSGCNTSLYILMEFHHACNLSLNLSLSLFSLSLSQSGYFSENNCIGISLPINFNAPLSGSKNIEFICWIQWTASV